MDPITLIFLGLLAILGIGGLVYVGFDKGVFIPGKHKITLAVFGLPQTGKTLFFNALQKHYGMQTEQTTVEKVESYKLYINETWLKFKSTSDIGGGDNYFREHAEQLIQDSNFIVYFCNIDEYLSSLDSARKVRARLQYIKKMMDKYSKKDEDVRIVLSYSDQVNDRNAAKESFVQSIASEKYAAFKNNVASVNMLDDKEVKKLIALLFYGK